LPADSLTSIPVPPCLSKKAEFGFNEHHQNEAINYMLFACSKRAIRLKTIDSCFEDLKDSRLVDKTFTVDEVRDMLDGLKLVVRGEVETELVNTAHTNMLLLRQLFSQAEKFYLRLQTDISELENRELFEQVAEFEKTEFKNQNKTNQEISKPKLSPLNEGEVSELLNKEISRLQEEKDQLKGRLRTMETLVFKSMICVSDLGHSYLNALYFFAASQRDLQDNLVSAKHDLLRVQEQLALAEKELDRKFQQTSAYRNMKEILTKKNEHIKDTRKRQEKYESDE
uniref:Leucine zipper transcription factor-like protein 1 n=1 Tax=Oncorhynchus kisutch TaxID=8019 RepID=A0A8C7CLM0_ONCKI